MQSRVTTTDFTSLHNGLTDPPASARLIGVVRDPTPAFERAVDTNERALGLPGSVREAIEERREALMRRGMCKSGAHNAAWEEAGAEAAYRRHLQTGPAREAVDRLRTAAETAEHLVLVCDGEPNLRSHRTIIKEALQSD